MRAVYKQGNRWTFFARHIFSQSLFSSLPVFELRLSFLYRLSPGKTHTSLPTIHFFLRPRPHLPSTYPPLSILYTRNSLLPILLPLSHRLMKQPRSLLAYLLSHFCPFS